MQTLTRSYDYLTIRNKQPVLYRKAEDVREEPQYDLKMKRIAKPVLIIAAVLLPLLVVINVWRGIGG